MSGDRAAGLSADPRDDNALEGIHTAIDAHGNPVCQGCGAGSFTMAARANSGLGFSCYCPPADRRLAEPIETRAEGIYRIIEALDLLDGLGHRLTCDCGACSARRILATGDPR